MNDEKTAWTLISLSPVFIMLFALTACGGLNGSYPLEGGDEVLKLNGSKWTMDTELCTLGGTYTK